MTPIDAVITWVDGSDPAQQARLAGYLQSRGGLPPKAADPTRFSDAGELEWCITSILRFAPFIRRIHIVSDQQTPELCRRLLNSVYAGRVVIVDHQTCFAGYTQHLPTFNSRAIISALHRIPDLAEHYLFFNDDFVLLQPVRAEDFFHDGRVQLRGHWQRQSHRRLSRRLVEALRRLVGRDAASNPDRRVRNVAAQEHSARLAGFADTFLRVEHLPFPQRRSTQEAYFAAHPDQLAHNLSFRLRSEQQFKTEVLAMHLEAKAGNADLDTQLRTVVLKPSEQSARRVRAKIAAADRDPQFAFGCVQSLEQAPVDLQREIVAWLNRRVGRLDELLSCQS